MKLSPEELEQGRLTPEHLELAELDLKTKGYVILEDVVADKAKVLNERFLELLEEQSRKQGANRGVARFNVAVPTDGIFADPDIIANPLGMQVIRAVLGDDIACSFYASDTPLPGSDYQAVHWDGRYLFPGLQVSLPPYALVLDIPLVDFTTENGPLEFWPYGTHLLPDFALRPADVLLGQADTDTPIQKYAKSIPPVQCIMPAGSVLIRDCRMWHRGSPNRSDGPRPMLAFMYHRPWFRFKEVSFSEETFNGLPDDAQQVFRFARVPNRVPPDR